MCSISNSDTESRVPNGQIGPAQGVRSDLAFPKHESPGTFSLNRALYLQGSFWECVLAGYKVCKAGCSSVK